MPPSVPVERCLSRPNRPTNWGAMNEFMKSLGTCLWQVPRGRHRWLPNVSCPPNLAIEIQSLSRARPSVWPAPWATTFWQGFARSHVTRSTCNRSVRNRYHRLSAVPTHRLTIRPSCFDQPFGLQRRKCLDRRADGHTYRHTEKHRPDYYFPATHQRKSPSKSLQC